MHSLFDNYKENKNITYENKIHKQGKIFFNVFTIIRQFIIKKEPKFYLIYKIRHKI